MLVKCGLRDTREMGTVASADIERFSKFVQESSDDDGCWDWIGNTVKGYGTFKLNNRTRYAHRIAWHITYGPIPTGMLICHKCDNTKCVRPDHLFLGTNDDNMQDMKNKGRHAHGKTHGHSTKPDRWPVGELHSGHKLTEQDIVNIRELYQTGMSQTAIAAIYQIAQAHISKIVLRRSWRHVA